MFVRVLTKTGTGPKVETSRGFVGNLSLLRERLNQAKTKLEEGYDEKTYYQVNKQLDRVEFLRRVLEKKYHAKHVTKAWMKMYEILSSFKMFPDSGAVNVLHLCEAPGSFILAFEHYIKHHRLPVFYNWKAQTLMREGALEDQYGIIKNNPDKWIKSYDDGDICSVKNILLYQRLIKADIVTSDVGIPVEKMTYNGDSGYNHQEELTVRLHLAQVTAGLHTLKPGGKLIVKTFTFFEVSSLSILYLLTTCFKKVCVTKPISSRPGNSEVYLVCMDYEPVSEEILKHLRDSIDTITPESSLFVIPLDFIRECIDIQSHLVNLQISALEYMVLSYQKYLHDKNSLKDEVEHNKRIQTKWLKKCQFTTHKELN